MIDFRTSGQLLYVSSVDVSVGNGPGVNEREFLVALHRAMGARAHFLIPRPVDQIPDIPIDRCTFSHPHHQHSMRHYPIHILSQMRLARRLLSRRHFDILVFRLDILPIAPLYITRTCRAPFALKTLGQNTLKALAEEGGWTGRTLAGINGWLVRQLVRGAIVADSVSQAQIAFLRESLDIELQQFAWIDNAVNTERFCPESTIDARRQLGLLRFDTLVGYIGTRPWERGGMQLVEAAARLVRKYTRLGVVILGDGAGLDSLKRRARELDVEDNCVFAGYVPLDKVPLYVNSLDVGASISLRADRQAASELKVRQYLACGKPVVASPGGNEFLRAADLGSIVPPTDIDAITKQLDRWLALAPSERDAFTSRASDYARRHLSMDRAICKRFELWSERMQSRTTTPAECHVF